MAREIPEAVRAAAGLAATVLDEARRLPRTLPAIPVRALGAVMQVTLKLQQHWSGLVARGDEVLTGLRGEAEPGLATFDEDLDEPASAGGNGFRSSAFDRVEVEDEAALVRQLADEVAADAVASDDVITDEEVARLPEDPAADAVVAAVEDMAHEIEGAEQVLEQLDEDTAVTADSDALETALLESEAQSEAESESGAESDSGSGTGDESAASPAEEAPAPPDPWGSPVGEEQPEPEPDADLTAPGTGPEDAPPEGSVDVVGPDGEVTTAEAAVTDEGVATVETDQGSAEPAAEAAPGGAEVQDESGGTVAAATGVRTDVDEDATDDDAGSEGAAAAGAAPVSGYDAFSIAQLRGHLRGYQRVTVSELLAYEEATRNREPFVRMLRNRLERLDRDAT